jgi:hypothetical protein
MQAALEIRTGSLAGTRVMVPPGQVVKVGRLKSASVVIADDPGISNLHFAVEWNGPTCRVRDLYSDSGTLVGGKKAASADLKDGDEIVAGKTTCVFRMAESVSAPVSPPSVTAGPANGRTDCQSVLPTAAPVSKAAAPPPTVPERVVDFLRQQKEPLFALVDAARDPMAVLSWLRSCGEEHQSLYEGPKGERLAAAAPYLVRLPAKSPALETLVRHGWCHGWGIYLTCGRPFADVRKHLRHFLLVQLPGGKQAYFRFYDPRVLRVYLPTCTPAEGRDLMGPVSAYYAGGAKPEEILHFFPTAGRPSPRVVVV